MKKILTIIADGFGVRGETKDNAIALAKMHTFEQFFKDHPHTLLDASQNATGLLPTEKIDCAHAHKVLGGGRIFHSRAFLINEFWNNCTDNETFQKLIKYKTKPTHLFCFLKKDNIKNIVNCYNELKKNNFSDIYIHMITYEESNNFLEKFCQAFSKEKIVSIVGSNFFADDNNEGCQKYYRVLTEGNSALQSINDYLKRYENWNVTFDNLKPAILTKDVNISMDDNVIWFDEELKNLTVLKAISDLGTNVFTYFKIDKDEHFNHFIDFEDDSNSLGVYLGKLNVKQARVAQNEKADILFESFDSTQKKIPDCDRIKIDGNKERPEMSIVDITKRVIDLMEKDYTYIVANFANLDEFGLKGDLNMAVQACMSVDVCLAKLIEEAENNFYTIIFISDHGRCDNVKHPEKCSSLVPFIISDDKLEIKEGGTIANYAATVLDYMEIKIPEEIKEGSLIINK